MSSAFDLALRPSPCSRSSWRFKSGVFHGARRVHGRSPSVLANARAMPKSVRVIWLSSSRRMLSSLTSRWTIRCLCRYSSATSFRIPSARFPEHRRGEGRGTTYELCAPKAGLVFGYNPIPLHFHHQVPARIVFLYSQSALSFTGILAQRTVRK